MNRQHSTAAFPRTIQRFGGLPGGICGSLDVVARSPRVVELQTGEDFVQMNTEQAATLRDALDAFLGLSKPADRDIEEREVVLVVAEGGSTEEVLDEPRPARPRSRKP